MFKLTLILPCYNEEQNIDNLFKNFYNLKNELENIAILFLDNGSTDDTYKKILENIERYKLTNFSHLSLKTNKGYGYGIKFALKNIKTSYAGISHADLQIPSNETIRIANKFLKEENPGLFMGKRTGRSLFNQIFTQGMIWFAFIFSRYKFQDINAQPKYFTNSNEYNFELFPNNFNFDLHLLLKTVELNKSIEYCKIDFYDRTAGKAKGGGSLSGKLKLTISTFHYLLNLNT
jgi:glycosyltransferase involved in cell wall biosynthesis